MNTPRSCCLLLVCVAAITTGCQHVSPWERGALADPVMNHERSPLANMMDEHMWFSREAASGGAGVLAATSRSLRPS